MSTANVVFLIDIQNGFTKQNLTRQQGGSLYVPGGADVSEPAARLIRSMSKATIILSQDYHPADHISFASNHPGVAPFSNMELKRGENGLYVPTPPGTQGDLSQTMWLDHCVQGTESCLFTNEIMNVLPTNLKEQLLQHSSEPALKGFGGQYNAFHVIRKGMRADLDSYGIATENDGVSLTKAPDIFTELANKYQSSGVTAVRIYIGGLATNYCVEFSHRDVCKHMVETLKTRGIRADIFLLTDICRGIPLSAPDGAWPDLDGAVERMKSLGAQEMTTDAAIRQSMSARRYGTRQLIPGG